MKRKIRMGMIGGGQGAFIGSVHRMAASLDGQIELVCGAFSSDPERSRDSGLALHLPQDRIYDSFVSMIRGEAALPENQRMDFVSIVTPNHMHFAPAMMALEHGFHVVCDKPLCLTLDEAHKLRDEVRRSGLMFVLTHNYTGYPMVKQARQMVRRGDLGKIRRVVVEYPQGWLSHAIEKENQKQAAWRTDPALAGAAGAMGDIGTHAENLAEYISGLKIESLFADLHTHVEGRRLDDDGSVLLRFEGGVRGVLYASQIAAGEENNLHIRIYGEKGSVDWSQMEPNSLVVRWLDQPMQVLRTGGPGLYPEAQVHTRLPSGHPEGYLEAFANIYRNAAMAMQLRLLNETVDALYADFPTVEDGLRGMMFVDAVVRSSKEERWINLPLIGADSR